MLSLSIMQMRSKLCERKVCFSLNVFLTKYDADLYENSISLFQLAERRVKCHSIIHRYRGHVRCVLSGFFGETDLVVYYEIVSCVHNISCSISGDSN
jgi:hypothetical protein